MRERERKDGRAQRDRDKRERERERVRETEAETDVGAAHRGGIAAVQQLGGTAGLCIVRAPVWRVTLLVE